ncbi:MAG: hypothetical protein HYY29_04420 [Chloroflexi bacterium]|nr:hypothetical protein [Chloroflexota bacterium]
MTTTVAHSHRPDIRAEDSSFQPVMLVLCGTTFGAKLLPYIVARLQSIHGGIPEWIRILVIDTNMEEMAGNGDYGGKVRFINLGGTSIGDIRAYSQVSSIASEAARDLPTRFLSQPLTNGSGKVMNATLVAWLDNYRRNEKIYDAYLDTLESLKTAAFTRNVAQGRVQELKVIHTGGAFGGVGAVTPLLSALTIRALGAQLSFRPEVTGIWAEAKQREAITAHRISGNMYGNYELVDWIQRETMRLKVPGSDGIEFQGGAGSSGFDYVFRISQDTSGKDIPDIMFYEAVAGFTIIWAANPVSDRFRAKSIDIRQTNTDTFRQMTHYVPNYQEYAVQAAKRGICDKALKETVSASASETAHSYCRANHIDPVILPQDMFPHGFTTVRETEWIPDFAKSAAGRGESDLSRDLDALMDDKYRSLEQQLDRAAELRRQKKWKELNAALSANTQEYLSNLDLGEASLILQTIADEVSSVNTQCKNQVESLKKAKEQAKEAKLPKTELLKAMNSFPVGRTKRVKQACNQLSDKFAAWLRAVRSYVCCYHAVLFLDDLGKELEKQHDLVKALMDSFTVIRTNKAPDEPLACRGDWNKIREAIPEKAEALVLIEEALGFKPDDPPDEVRLSLANELRNKIPTWPACPANQICDRIEEFLASRLEGLAKMDLAGFLDWKAKRDNCTQSAVGRRLVEDMKNRLSETWLPLISTALPENGVPTITILAVPGNNNLAGQFFLPEDLQRIEVLERGVPPTEIILASVMFSIPQHAISMMGQYKKGYDAANKTDLPIIPPILLEWRAQQAATPPAPKTTGQRDATKAHPNGKQDAEDPLPDLTMA